MPGGNESLSLSVSKIRKTKPNRGAIDVGCKFKCCLSWLEQVDFKSELFWLTENTELTELNAEIP
jgi:hypothetical protein